MGRTFSISAVAVVLAAVLLLLPAVVVAHPLGNFTINHYAEVRVEPDRVLLDVVIDQAEIATFQSRQDFDTDADGSVSDDEIETGRLRACDELAPDLHLAAGDEALELRTIEAGLSFPPGVGGLATMRLVCAYVSALGEPVGADATRISFSDASYPDRLGWREIVARGSGVSLAVVEGASRAASISSRLTAYPEELLDAALADTGIVLEATAGGPQLQPFDVPDAGPVDGAPSSSPGEPPGSEPPPGSASPATSPSYGPAAGAVPGGVAGGEVPGIFGEADLTPVALLASLLLAAALGALHAVTPGHGKTLMAASLIGARGTPLQAIGLGLSVSFSHTVGVLVMAGLVLGALDALPPDVVLRWVPVVTAVSIAGIGGWMLAGELRRRGTARARSPHHAHDHDHDHAAPPGSIITWRSLVVLGLAGGLLPSTSALLILLLSIEMGRPAFGLVLVVAFGLGMAAVMGGIGLAIVTARERLDRVRAGERLRGIREAAPLAAAVLVLGFGLYLTAQALVAAPAF